MLLSTSCIPSSCLDASFDLPPPPGPWESSWAAAAAAASGPATGRRCSRAQPCCCELAARDQHSTRRLRASGEHLQQQSRLATHTPSSFLRDACLLAWPECILANTLRCGILFCWSPALLGSCSIERHLSVSTHVLLSQSVTFSISYFEGCRMLQLLCNLLSVSKAAQLWNTSCLLCLPIVRISHRPLAAPPLASCIL